MRRVVLQIIGGIGIATVIFGIVLGISWFWLTKVTVPPSKEPKGYFASDWPNGSHSKGDHWRSGTIFEMSADRIRRVALRNRSGEDVNSLTFYMSIPMSENDYEAFLQRLESTEAYGFTEGGSWPRNDFKLIPEWFPPLNESNFIGFAKDESSLFVYIFRPPKSLHVFFVLS